LNELANIFLNNLLPVFLAAGSGFILAKIIKINPQPISKVILYIFSPCLVFSLLTQNELGHSDILKSMLFLGTTIGIVGLIAWLVTRFLKFERTISAGIILTSMLMNAGNYGMPVVLFAFGASALGYASIYFVTMAILTYTVGIVIASMGTASFKTGFLNLLKLPVIYAIALAFIVMITGWQLPIYFERTVLILGDAAIPTMLVLLGINLANVQLAGFSLPLFLAITFRLLVSPAVALLLVTIFGLGGPARASLVTIAGMPSAVFTSVLATEYNLKPSFVTAIVFTSTLLSPLTLTPLLAFLGA
jgi:predicted permease